MATGITIADGPFISNLIFGKLNCFISSLLKIDKNSSKLLLSKRYNDVFLNKFMLSFCVSQIFITFPKILNFPPIISEILSLERYCS